MAFHVISLLSQSTGDKSFELVVFGRVKILWKYPCIKLNKID